MKVLYVIIGMILFAGAALAIDSGALNAVMPSGDTGGAIVELGGPGEPYVVQPCKPLTAYVEDGRTGEIVWPENLDEYCEDLLIADYRQLPVPTIQYDSPIGPTIHPLLDPDHVRADHEARMEELNRFFGRGDMPGEA